MDEGREPPSIAERLSRFASREDGATARTVRMLQIQAGTLAYELRPGPDPSLGVVLCPSFFESKTMQASELALADRVCGEGMYALYVQPPGTGESFGDPEDVRFEGRVDVALEAARYALSEGGCSRIAFFGCRLGGAVAIRAAQRNGAASYAVWDPVIDGATYLKQARRLDRIAAMAGRRKGYESLEAQLAARPWATLLGNVVTREIYADLSSLSISATDPVQRGLVVCLDDGSRRAALAALSSFTESLASHSLGRKHLGHLGFAPDDAAASIPLTSDWLKDGRDD